MRLGLGFARQRRDVVPGWVLPEVVGRGLQYEFTRGQYWLGSGLTARANVLSDTRASDALFDNAAGVYSVFGTNVPAITDRGLYAGGQRVNKCTNDNANPVDLTNLTLTNSTGGAPGPGVTLTVVDDARELAAAGLSGVCTSGKVYKLDNSASGGTSHRATFGGTPGNTNLHALSCCMRGSGSAQLRFQGSTSSTGMGTQPLTSGYQRWVATGVPNVTTFPMYVLALPGSVVYFILNQLEEGSFASPPIVTAGSAARRLADSLTIPDFAAKAAAFGFASGMAALARVNLTRLSDPSARRIMTFGTAADGAYIEFTTANTFKAVLRKANGAAATLTSGAVSATGVYDVTVQFKAGDYSLTVSGGIAGATSASAETLPAAIASAAYIGRKEDATLHTNGPLERLAMWRAP